jgi:hypothetical protein
MNWLILLSAIWLALSPFILGVSGNTGFLWNNLLLGMVLGFGLQWRKEQIKPE